MAKYNDKVRDFHKAMNLPVHVPFNADLLAFRKLLIGEETEELFAELDAAMEQLQTTGEVARATFENICKEMADVQYVLTGLAVSFGLPLEAAFNATHASNMTKLGPNGKPIYREDGKVIKGSAYRPPDMSALKQKIDK